MRKRFIMLLLVIYLCLASFSANATSMMDYITGQQDFHEAILGARKGLDDTGMADKNLIQLRPGDEITTIHYAATISGDDDFEAFEADTFTVSEDTSFYETDMGDGQFVMMFELIDATNTSYYSAPVEFIVEGDDIYTQEW